MKLKKRLVNTTIKQRIVFGLLIYSICMFIDISISIFKSETKQDYNYFIFSLGQYIIIFPVFLILIVIIKKIIMYRTKKLHKNLDRQRLI